MSQKAKVQAAPSDRLKATLSLDESASIIKGISAARLKMLANLKVRTVRDLLMHFPRRYVDLSQLSTTYSAKIGDTCTISGKIVEISHKRPRRNLDILEISIADDTGVIIATMFNKPWLQNKMNIGDRVAISGKVEFNYGFKRMNNPYLEELGDREAEGRIIAIYPATEKLTNTYLRSFVSNALHVTTGMFDILPIDLRLSRNLISRQEAFNSIHRPASMNEIEDARNRLVYDELLMLELHLIMNSLAREEGKTPVSHRIDGQYLSDLEDALPFDLTQDQLQAKNEILEVMHASSAANHMILGDVGTGKTIVAAFAIASAKDSNSQVLFLAPTEVLAQQHYSTLGSILGGIGIRVALLTGSVSKEERDAIVCDIASGNIDLLIGTHAILEPDIVPANMSLAIIDEQQRFGVNQRSNLIMKGECPDALYLTATPIPRTMALAMFGNLSLSYIKQKPNETSRRDTFVVRRDDIEIAYDGIRRAMEQGHQAYVVCPLVGLDSKTRDSLSAFPLDDEEENSMKISIEDLSRFDSENVSAAVEEADFLQKKVFPERKVALLYGSMKSSDKKDVMDRFKRGEIDILVSTTVIEVGVDVGNATVMIVEDADRFGLSQLHQLRGRVGRGEYDSEVYLVSASSKDMALDRLRALESCDDGFEIARFDLSMRREGDLLGSRQSGISALRIADIFEDEAILVDAFEDAKRIIEVDPHLKSAAYRALGREMRMIFDDTSSIDGG